MKKLIFRLCLAAMAIGCIIIAMHVAQVWHLRDAVEQAYSLKPEEDVLVLGSSEVGCGIANDPRFHAKKIWVSSTSTMSHLMRLRELARRQQLAHVKVLIVPFDFTTIMAQSLENEQWAWYQELPLSMKYLDGLPCGILSMLGYISANLRWPFNIHVSDRTPQRGALSERPEKWKEDFIKTQCRPVSENFESKLMRGWSTRLYEAYKQMAVICRQHGIRLVVVQIPLLPQYRNAQGHKILQLEKDWYDRIGKLGVECCRIDVQLDDRFFFDTRHLVEKGAMVFTEKLYQALNISTITLR